MATSKAKNKQASTAKKQGKLTPLMAQYYSMKEKYPGAMMLFRVGDFYETFDQDALDAAQILNITLTKRSNGAASEVDLAGFPYHALETYLPKLVKAGKRVAICDQLEDPSQAKGLVQRGVTEMVTPGVALSDSLLDSKRNNYLACLHKSKGDQWGLAFLDISTGEFIAAESSHHDVHKLLEHFAPQEIIYNSAEKQSIADFLDDSITGTRQEEWVFTSTYARDLLTRHFKTQSLKGFGIEKMEAAIIACGAILNYLKQTGHESIGHITRLRRFDDRQFVWLDRFTIRNLELIEPNHEGGRSLLAIMDRTSTSMGARLLVKWILMPLKQPAAIQQRLDTVGSILANSGLMDELAQKLKGISDLERLVSKIASRKINPRELLMIKSALSIIGELQPLLAATNHPFLVQLSDRLHPCQELREKLDKALKEHPPVQLGKGDVLAFGQDAELDDLRNTLSNSRQQLEAIREREQEITQIPRLKIKFNKVFGYYLEVANTHKDKVPENWQRKQTLVNAERYITPELKEFEQKILTAEERIATLEQQLYEHLVQFCAGYMQVLQANARHLAELDCLNSFSHLARQHRYCRPMVNEKLEINIEQGRHPVIEQEMAHGENYIPNDIRLENNSQQVSIITGPNMAGKSALLRQTALISLMAQMGSYVPAQKATIGVVDKVFTRVGASDNLAMGESTFMVEMNETASILNNITERSLIIMDEIGRGTGTYDGISIAWSIVEFLHDHEGRPKTLFATHYHELNALEEELERTQAWHVAVKEAGDKMVFLRQLKPGGVHHSFGIYVAQMAGMPRPVVLRAQEVMHTLEGQGQQDQHLKALGQLPTNQQQMDLFSAPDPKAEELRQKLQQIDTNTISPIEALLKLNELKLIGSS